MTLYAFVAVARCNKTAVPFHKHSNSCAMQCFSYAIRSQSVLTTIQLGMSPMFSIHYSTRILNMSEIATIACLHNLSGPVLLSCSEILTYQLLGSQLLIVLSTESSR